MTLTDLEFQKLLMENGFPEFKQEHGTIDGSDFPAFYSCKNEGGYEITARRIQSTDSFKYMFDAKIWLGKVRFLTRLSILDRYLSEENLNVTLKSIEKTMAHLQEDFLSGLES